MDAAHLVLLPILSEKTYDQSLNLRTYAFKVVKSANKQQVAEAVSKQFDVKVVSVKSLIVKGKAVRTPSGKRQPIEALRSNYKKAYVTLAEGNSIKIFEEAK